MKINVLVIALIGVILGVKAQTNIFTSSGNVGVGTTNPIF